MITPEAASEILEMAVKAGGDFADLFLERKETTNLHLEDGKLETYTSGVDQGAGLRVIVKNTTFHTYTDTPSMDSLRDAARALADAVRSKAAEGGAIVVAPLVKAAPLVEQTMISSPADVNQAAKADVVLRADRGARDAGTVIRQVVVDLADSIQRVMIVNSEGRHAEDTRVLTRLFVNAVATRDGNVQTGYEAPGILGGYELFDQEHPEDVGLKAAERAIVMLDAKEAPVGEMPVVLAGGTSGVLFHEASGHGLEADAVRKGASVYAGKIGAKIAADVVSAADDPSLKNKWGSFTFDDEGTPAVPTLLIENGFLAGYMYDRLTAWQMNAAPTPNGRRQSFRHIPQPRMTNTFIMPGPDPVEAMFEGVKKGLYAKSLGGGEVNPVTGEFVFGVTEGYAIEDGKVGHPVQGAVLIGDGPRVLLSIDRIADDIAFDTGMCGKGGQAVPAGTGQPTLRISSLTVGGTKR